MNLEEKIKYALECGPVVIYGAHLIAVEVYRYIRQTKMNTAFAGFAVTAAEGNPKEIMGEKVSELSSCQYPRDATLLIAMPEKFHSEAQKYAEGFGFSSFIRIGLEDMSRIKGCQLLYKQRHGPGLNFHLYEDPYDASWLNITRDIKTTGSACDLKRKHFKFPTLFYLDEETVFREAAQFDFDQEYERLFGTYRNLHALPEGNVSGGGELPLHIYMVFSQWDSARLLHQSLPLWIYPIQAGSALTANKAQAYLDESGDSVSNKNGVLAEMTAAYWIWKNVKAVKYKGLCHYRRHFLFDKENVMEWEACGVDVILPTPRFVPGGVRQMFLEETPVKQPVYQMLLQAVSDCHPEDIGTLEALMDACLYCPNNMVVAKSEIYDAYCAWIFPVLFRMMELDEECQYGHAKDRHIAYAAELLTSCFFSLRKGIYRIYVTDYKFIV